MLKPDRQQMGDDEPEAEERNNNRAHNSAKPHIDRVWRELQDGNKRFLGQFETGVSKTSEQMPPGVRNKAYRLATMSPISDSVVKASVAVENRPIYQSYIANV
jgi:hypothetical protein